MRAFTMNPVLGLFSILLAAVSASCSVGGPGSAPSFGISPAPSVFVPIPPHTPLPSAQPTRVAVTSTPAATIFVPFEVMALADNVLLRSNPGYLFSKLSILDKGASLLVLGRSPGGEWLLVKTADNHVGWVFALLVDYQGNDPVAVPFMMPSSVQQIAGTVKDDQGQPISGIQFSLTQGAGTGAPRNDAMTDSSGNFYAFMPADAQGTWLVSFTAVACSGNPADPQCNRTGSPQPESVNVTLPLKQGEILTFVWK
jgi:hypothetical protein